MPDDILTPEEVRAMIEARERHDAELARFFPPHTDEQFRYIWSLRCLV